MRTVADGIDRGMALLKWPTAVVALLVLPGGLWAAWELLLSIAGDPLPMLPFLGGLVLYTLLWWKWLREPSWGSLLSTLEHELTHALFALLTFHRVVGFRTTWRSGGHVKYRGRGNWLITSAPYFFPTASLAVLIALIWVPRAYIPWVNGLLGVTMAYHITSTLSEVHPSQTDLQKVGFVFSFAFLPFVNVMAYSALLAFAHRGYVGAVALVESAFARNVQLVSWVWALIF